MSPLSPRNDAKIEVICPGDVCETRESMDVLPEAVVACICTDTAERTGPTGRMPRLD